MIKQIVLPLLTFASSLTSAQQTISVNPTETTAAIQQSLNSASPGDMVAFAAGTYNLTGPLFLPCGAIMTGPLSVPATAILSATFTWGDLTYLSGCETPTTIQYLQFANTGGIYITAPSVGVTVIKNQFTNLPADGNQQSNAAVYFDGKNGGTISDAVIRNNTFGDPTSCTAVMSLNYDAGGLCAGIQFQGDLDGVVIEKNEFTHLEEGFHVLCYGNVCGGSNAPTWNNFTVQWNDFNNIHRIAAEMQPQNASNVTLQYNSYENAFAPSTFTMGFSAACCAGIPGISVPLINDNVLIANTPPAGEYIAYAVEWWGDGAQADKNLIQGFWDHGIVWGKGGPPWEVLNNTIEGQAMAGLYGCYVCNENEGATADPAQSGNTESTQVAPLVSTAPQISQSNGMVVITDAEPNTSIYYTTDGSTPTTDSRLYTKPFPGAPGETVSAIGMWGKGANPKSYPAGYGYVPSGVVTAAVESEAAPVSQALVGAYLVAKGNLSNIKRGSTLQFEAHGLYADGSDQVLPDAAGNAVSLWNTSDHTIATISRAGHLTALGTGMVTVEALVGDIVATPAKLGVVDTVLPVR